MVEKVEAKILRNKEHVRTETIQVDARSDVDVELTEIEPDEFMCQASDDCTFTSDSEQGIESHERQAH